MKVSCAGVRWLAAFEENAARHPARAAVVYGEETITYSALAARADDIAAHLSRHAAEDPYVGIAIGRTPSLLPALLGVIKSGAAYIPIDPAYPAARIEAMVRSAKIRTVLTAENSPALPQDTRAIPVSSIPASGSPFSSRADATKPIYAIFTSGSTGDPKAATVIHSGFDNLVSWYLSELSFAETDVALVISSPSFDLTQKNFYAPLAAGGTIVLDSGTTYDISRISSLTADHRATVVNCTPSAFLPLLENPAALASLRFAVLGGEPIPVPRVRSWLTHPSCRAEIMNSYGPTECTDICLFHRLHRGNLDEFPFVPLGREIPNVEVSILDENLRPVPDGETGELCISGAGVGGGYLHDEARTADHFPRRGLYKTGDIARRLPCGTYEFRGRADHQIKLNGFRVELGEIEAALLAHPDVRDAIVTHERGILTAHLVGEARAEILKPHLARLLPAYMVPGVFTGHLKFPLTPNGKADRRLLSSFTTTHSPPETPPENDLERALLALWSELLGRPVPSPEANFFDIGGTSIHIAVAHSRVKEIVKRDLPITDLFAHPSARSLARHLSSPVSAAASSATERAKLARNSFTRFPRPSRP